MGKFRSDPFYQQCINDEKLESLSKGDYSLGCGDLYFDRDWGVNSREILKKWIPMMKRMIVPLSQTFRKSKL